MANDDKITLEVGRFNWDAARGYEAPADGGSGLLPPGWGEEPAIRPRDIPLFQERRVVEIAPPPEPVVAEQDLEQFIPADAFPEERVNLDNGTAVFRGHHVMLSQTEIDCIKVALAAAVVRQLDEERERVLASLQLEGLQVDGGTGPPNVPEVPGPAGQVGEETAS